ncbi:MAG: homoserine dehydrogenase [Methyloligellaceae bacterium]
MTDSLKLGIAGLGTVGAGLLKIFETNSEVLALRAGRSIQVTGVSARDRNKDRGVDLSGIEWFDDSVALATSDNTDVFVELIGGETGTAKDAVVAAIKAGKHVVTANKALLAHCGYELSKLAEEHGVALNYEAAVAGGIPVVKAMRESLAGNDISRVFGILNGTCNYILTKMELEGRSYQDVLVEAQEAGYAEADPTFDVGGFDAAHKLSLLTSLAFGVETSFDTVYVEGIENITGADIEAAAELGYRIKLLGVAARTDEGIEQRVHPTMVPRRSAIAKVDGVTNCVAIEGDFVGDVMLVGPGAGAGPTASSVMSDIVDIARGVILAPFTVPARDLKPNKSARLGAHEGCYYIRLSLHDTAGAFASIAERMAEQDISLESIVQKRPRCALPGIDARVEEGKPMAVVMITHETCESSVRIALEAIEADGKVDEKPQMIRIETL